MPTPNIVPNANNEGRLGKSGLQWLEVRAQNILLNGVTVAPTSSPIFTGTVTCPNPDPNSDTTVAATTSWVRNLLELYSTYSGSPLTSGKIVFYNGAALETSSKSVADTLDLAQHTGILPAIKVATTGLFVGATTIVDDITDLQTTTQTLVSDLNTAESEIANLETSVATLQGENTSLAASVTALQTTTSGLTTSVTALQTTTSGLTTNVTSLQTTTSGLTDSVTALQTATSGLTASVTALQTTTSGLTTSVTALQTTTSGLTASVTALQTTTSGLTASVTALQTTTSGLTASVNTLDSDVATLQSDLITLDTNTTASINSINSTITDIGQDLSILTITVNGKANTVHTHSGADITDADSGVGAANTIVKRNSTGGILAKATAASSSALKGDATGTSAYGVHGTSTGSTGIAGYFSTSSTTFPGSGITSTAEPSSSCPAASLIQRGSGNYLELRNNTGVADIKFAVSNSLDLQWRNVSGSNTKSIAVGTASASRVATLPDATGTIVLGDGSGITDVTAFKNVLGIGSLSNPEFSTVTVTSNVANGYNFSSGAKLVLENPSNTTIFKLPHGAGVTINLVDGAGRGVSDASAFRTAIGTVSKTGDTFTGIVTVDPSSSSNTMFNLVGANGQITTISCNATTPRTIEVPDTNGKFVVTPTGSVIVTSTNIVDSTTIGRAVLTSATHEAAREAINAAESAESAGYIDAYITYTATTTTSQNGFQIATADVVATSGSSGFIISDTTKLAVTKTFPGSKKYLVSVVCSIEMPTNHPRTIVIAIFKNTVKQRESSNYYYPTDIKIVQFAIQAIVSIDDNDVVSLRFEDRFGAQDGKQNLIVRDATMTVVPIGMS